MCYLGDCHSQPRQCRRIGKEMGQTLHACEAFWYADCNPQYQMCSGICNEIWCDSQGDSAQSGACAFFPNLEASDKKEPIEDGTPCDLDGDGKLAIGTRGMCLDRKCVSLDEAKESVAKAMAARMPAAPLAAHRQSLSLIHI